MNHTIKTILNTAPVLFLAVFLFATATYAQTFVQPGSAPTAGNVIAPLNVGSGGAQPQTKYGDFWAGSVNSAAGYLLSGPNNFTSSWTYLAGLNTLSIEQLCVGSYCTSSLASTYPSADIYINGTSCNGGVCAGDAYTGAELCKVNGYSHLVGLAIGGNGNSQNIYYWNGSSWSSYGSGCSSSCGQSALTMITCDNNGTSPLSEPDIAANNGTTNVYQDNLHPGHGGGGGGGGSCNGGNGSNGKTSCQSN